MQPRSQGGGALEVSVVFSALHSPSSESRRLVLSSGPLKEPLLASFCMMTRSRRALSKRKRALTRLSMSVCFLQLLPTFEPPPDPLYARGEEQHVLILLKPAQTAPFTNFGRIADHFLVVFSRPSTATSLPRRPGTLSVRRRRAASSPPAAGCASARAPEARRARRGRRMRLPQDRSLRTRSRCMVGLFGFDGSLLARTYVHGTDAFSI